MSFFCLICISSFIPERDLGKQTFEITWRVPNISLVNYDGEDHPSWPWLVYLKNPNTSYLRFMFICKSSVCFIDVVCMCSSLHIKYNIFNIFFVPLSYLCPTFLAALLHLSQKIAHFSFRDLSALYSCDLLFLLSVTPGHHQQHRHPQHDFHQNLPKVWPVGRQPGQHRLRSRLLHRAAAAAGEHNTHTHFRASLIY